MTAFFTGSTSFLGLQYLNLAERNVFSYNERLEEDAVRNASANTVDTWAASASLAIATLQVSGSSTTSTSPTGQTVWVASSAVSASEYSNGLGYIPLPSGSNSSIDFQFVSGYSGSLNVDVFYAMSSANAGTFEARLDYAVINEGSAPDTAHTTQSSFTVTPGSVTTLRRVSVDTTGSMCIPGVLTGSIVLGRVWRRSAATDTHPGNVNVVEIRVRS